jgi:hypothetical protein
VPTMRQQATLPPGGLPRTPTDRAAGRGRQWSMVVEAPAAATGRLSWRDRDVGRAHVESRAAGSEWHRQAVRARSGYHRARARGPTARYHRD